MGIFSKFENKMEDTVEGAASRMSKAPISPVQIAKKAEKQMRRETMVGAGKQYAPTLYTVLVNVDDDNRLFGYYPTLAGETETYLSAKATQEGLVMDGQPLVRFIVDDRLRHGKFDVIAELVAAPIIARLREEEMERYGLVSHGGRAGAAAGGYGASEAAGGAGGYGQVGGYGQAGGYGAVGAAGVGGYGAPEATGGAGGYGQAGGDGSADAAGAGAAGTAAGYGAQQAQPVQQRKPPLPYVPEDEIDRSIDYGEYTFNSEDFEDYRNTPDGQAAPGAYNDAYAQGQGQQIPFATPGGGAGAGAVAAGAGTAGTAGTAGAAGAAGPPQQQMQQANTVAFAGAQTPDQHSVRARLVDRSNGRPYDLGAARVTIGRESGNDIPVADVNASRRHAELMLNQQGLWVISDLKSMNGTLVNGVSVASQPLYPGDIVTIGTTDFEFTLV